MTQNRKLSTLELNREQTKKPTKKLTLFHMNLQSEEGVKIRWYSEWGTGVLSFSFSLFH